MMHPSMLEQMGREHSKDLQALAAPRARRTFALVKRRRRQAQPISAAASGIAPAGCAPNALSA